MQHGAIYPSDEASMNVTEKCYHSEKKHASQHCTAASYQIHGSQTTIWVSTSSTTWSRFPSRYHPPPLSPRTNDSHVPKTSHGHGGNCPTLLLYEVG